MNIPQCPNCGSTAQPDLIKVNILSATTLNDTYEELYECGCGCKFVVLNPRILSDIKIHKIEW